ncbi:MAG: FtsW/RodA/SpoVE family cell cycle protein [Hyphomicrobiales bacterium]
MKFNPRIELKGDKIIWITVLFLFIFSLLTVYSASVTLAYKYKQGDTEYYLLRQFVMLSGGLVAMYFAHKIPYWYYSRISQIAMFIAVPLLIITLFMGVELNDAKRVLPLPFGFSFQTSDLGKLALMLYLARLLTKKQSQIKSFKDAFVPLMIPVLIVCGLIVPENFSTAALLFFASLVLMFIGRVNIKYILSLLGLGVAIFALFILFMYAFSKDDMGRISTWKSRIETFMDDNPDSESYYQVEQSKIAIAKGGLIGVMPGNSQQKNFLPHPYSDFIFAIIIEEYGLIGSGFIILLYLVIFYRAIKIVARFPKHFGAFLAFGLSFLMILQAMINMGVAVNLLPVTGQPLPLVSAGGTSTILMSISVGIILSVSKETVENNEQHAIA